MKQPKTLQNTSVIYLVNPSWVLLPVAEMIHSSNTDSSHFCPVFSHVVDQELSKQRRAVDCLDNMIGRMGKGRLKLREASIWAPGGHNVGRDWRQRLGSCG